MAFDRLHLFLAASFLAVAAVPAQTPVSGLQGPVLGYLSSPQTLGSSTTFALKPIHGVPGAVVMGDSLALPPDVSSVSIAPGHSFAVVQTAGGLAVVTLDGEAISEPRAIAGAEGRFDQVTFSSSGSALAAYSSSEKKLVVVRGMPTAPEIAGAHDLSPLAPAEVTAGAVSDDGQTALLGFADGVTGSIWQFRLDQSPRKLLDASFPSAMAIRHIEGNAVELAMLDGAEKTLRLLNWDGQVSSSRVLADGLGAPTFLQLSADGRSAWVGDSGNRILSVDLSSGAIAAVPSRVAASRMTKLGGNATYLIEATDGSSALWNPVSIESKIWLLSAR